MQLQRELVRNCDHGHNCFTNTVVNNSNKLLGQIVYDPTVNSFKAQIDEWAILNETKLF
jgi:hypothetical protein